MWWLLAAVFGVVGAGLGGLIAFGLVAVVRKAAMSNVDMWRLGAGSGLTTRDRAFAKRQFDQSSELNRFLLPIVMWFLRIFLPIFGAGLGLALAQKVGGQA